MDFSFFKKENISIIGHDNPDIDSILSGILLEKLLVYLGVNANFTILDNYIDETIISILKKFNIDVSKYMCSTLQSSVILVDHHKTKHIASVVGIIDHHPTIQNISCNLYLNEPSPSTTLHIYNLMVKHNYPISKKIIELVVLGAYTDTCSLKSSKVLDKDRQFIHTLINKYDLNANVLYEEGLLLRDLKTMKFEHIFKNALKDYTFGDVNIKSSYLRLGNISEINFIISDLIAAAKKEIKYTPIKKWVFVIVALKEEKTLEITVSEEFIERQIYNNILSRGKDIIPKIEYEILNKKQKAKIV